MSFLPMQIFAGDLSTELGGAQRTKTLTTSALSVQVGAMNVHHKKYNKQMVLMGPETCGMFDMSRSLRLGACGVKDLSDNTVGFAPKVSQKHLIFGNGATWQTDYYVIKGNPMVVTSFVLNL